MPEQAKDVAVTGDHWTSVSNNSYWGITAHFTDKEWTLQLFALTVSETAEGRYAEARADHFWMSQKNGKSRRRYPHLALTVLVTWLQPRDYFHLNSV